MLTARILPFVLVMGASAASHAGTPFLRGDTDGDGIIDVSDPVKTLFWLIGSGEVHVPLDALDADDDGNISLTDVLYDLNFVFLSGPLPPPPFPEVGFDTTTSDPYIEGDEIAGSDDTPRPDLAVKGFSFDADQTLLIDLKNEGNAEVPAGKGTLAVFIDGQALRVVPLAELSDQSFRVPGTIQTVRTDLRLAGSHRRLAIVVDPEDEIEEGNELQNTLTRTVSLPVPTGPDLVIGDLSLSVDGELEVVVQNDGSTPSSSDLDAVLSVSVGGRIISSSVVLLPPIAVGATAVAHAVPPVTIDVPQRVRVALETAPADEIDNSNNVREKTLPEGSSQTAFDALLAAPGIGGAILWEDTSGVRDYRSWSAEERDELLEAFLSLENGVPYELTEPPALLAGNSISAADAWRIFLAHVAQSVWVEVHSVVGWSLLALPDDQLADLLDGRRLFRYVSPTDTYRFESSLMGNVTAWNPRVAFEFLSNLGRIRATELKTILALTDWIRAHLIHTSAADVFSELFGYAGPPPVDRVLYALEGKKHKTAGCWGTSGLYAAVLRSVNIPTHRRNQTLLNGTHSRPEFPSVDRSMPHGDDPYNAVLMPSGAAVPSARLLYTLAQMKTRFEEPELDCGEAACNTVGEQASYNAGKDHWQFALAYLSDYPLYEYAVHGSEYLDDSLRGPRIGGGVQEYAKPYFEEAERASVIAEVEARLTELGGGDLESGKAVVRQRYGRWGENR